MEDERNVAPNWKMWAKREFWEIHEFARLACGVSGDAKDSLDLPTLQRVHEIEGLANRSTQADALEFRPTPARWAEWADQKDIEIPGELRDAVEKYSDKRSIKKSNPETAAIKNRPEDRPFGATERNKMLRMIAGMAAAAYGVDLQRPYQAAKEIANDLKERGIAVSDDSVAKYLKAAAEVLARDLQEKQ